MENDKYLVETFEKFNSDPNSPSLTENEKILLNALKQVKMQAVELEKEIDKLNKEILERQQQGDRLYKQLMRIHGQVEAFSASLLILRKEN